MAILDWTHDGMEMLEAIVDRYREALSQAADEEAGEMNRTVVCSMDVVSAAYVIAESKPYYINE